MSINIKNDPLRSAILFGRPVLFASQRIPREEVPEGWYYYELRGSVRNAKKPVALSDHAYVNPIGSVLSPVPLKRADTISRRVNGQFLLLGETMTLRDYCRNNSLEYPLRNQTFAIRPASPEEAGIFYAMPPEEDAALSAIGHVRMDFGRSGKDFWHTWHPRGPEELNNAAFKAELQEVVDELRASVLKDYNAMTRYCESHGGKIDGGWVQNYGYIIETEGYRYCLRCNPVQGDYSYAQRLGVREGFVPVLIQADDETLLECLVMNADPEHDADFYEFDLKTVTEYRKKMLSAPVKDGKAVLEELTGQRKEEAEDDDLDWEEEVLGEMEGGEPNDRFANYWNDDTGMTYPLILAKIPVKKPWEIFTYLPFGNWNECPDTPDLMAVAKYWFEQHGAIPAAMSHDELEFELPTPISKERAMEVAVEQYGFCPDLDQNEDGSIGSLADVLWQSTVWYFWWD